MALPSVLAQEVGGHDRAAGRERHRHTAPFPGGRLPKPDAGSHINTDLSPVALEHHPVLAVGEIEAARRHLDPELAEQFTNVVGCFRLVHPFPMPSGTVTTGSVLRAPSGRR